MISPSSWYDPRLMANPWFQPNEVQICRLAHENQLPDRADDEQRNLVLVVDFLNAFTYPPTFVDPYRGGTVTRVLPLALQQQLEVLEEWVTADNNFLVWSHHKAPLQKFLNANISMFGGHLSVPNGWIAVRDSVEWCLKNADKITDYALLRDCHRVTSRWNMHYWVANGKSNPFGLSKGEHPCKKSDTEFFLLMPDMVWHPRHNPDGFLRPIYDSEMEVDEASAFVRGTGLVVLWDIHATDGTVGANIDPLFMATVLDHAYRRKAEPHFYNKGMSGKTESFGTEPVYTFSGDKKARAQLSFRDLLLGGTTLIGRPYDRIIVFGLADTHCVPAVLLDGVKELVNCGCEHLTHRILYAKPFCRGIPGFEKNAVEQENILRVRGVRIITDVAQIFPE